ncbi:hypothetical protein [Bradyrhizobium roseum]|uniref:hypothetical protein n=1 Tax=Bradyrhizobium roseum TaxID=3056648 RepID=UPI00260B3A73|nr:hypothetical protein [Bradyrhizobium roseus]WKA27950.1 hypothetical protein QUH67_31055 [Bradyrhizobium roseus]
MARFTLWGDQRRADLEQPIDEAPSPPMAPAPPSATPPEDAPPLIDTPSPSTAPTFSGLGTTFNNAVQAPVSSLPQTTVDQGSLGTSGVANIANELTTVHNGLLAEVGKGQLSGAALGHVQAILSDINTAISTANATANTAAMIGNTAAAEQSLRASNLDMVNAVNTVKANVALTNLALASAPAAVPEAPAPLASLAEIGASFNDVANDILGGVTDDNRAGITEDLNTVIKDLQTLISAKPEMFEGAVGEHANEVLQQLQLELAYINDPDISPDAARASIDNILDIIEIVQSDPKLAEMATQDGVSGFSPIPGVGNPAEALPENDVQTVFTANFIAQSNSLGQQAIDLVGSGDINAIAALIDNLKAFEKFVAEFDAAQGGDALLTATGALGAEVAAIIKGLQTGDATLVTAAADQMHGNAADVSASNVPVTGGSYNPNGATVTEVLGTAPVAEPPAAVSAAESVPALDVVSPIGAEPVTLAAADVSIAIEDHGNADMPDLAHQLHHTWG